MVEKSVTAAPADDPPRSFARLWGAVAAIATLALVATSVTGEELAAKRLRLERQLSQALDDQDRWLGDDKNGEAWRKILATAELRSQIDSESLPDVTVLEEILDRYEHQTAALDRPRFVAVRRSLEGWLKTLPEPSLDELSNMARSAAELQFQLDAARLADSRKKLDEAIVRLSSYLARSGRNGVGWRSYLAIDALTAELRKGEAASLSRLESILILYQRGHGGLELPAFRDVRHALESYCKSLRASRLDDPQAAIQSTLNQLVRHLARIEGVHRARSVREVGEALAWLDDHGIAPHVARAVRRRYVRPNLYAQVDGNMLFSQFEQQRDETFFIRQSMNGAYVTGTGRLIGRIDFQFVPNDEQAVVQMLFHGTIHTDTVGSSGPVGFSADGFTRLTGLKILFADADGLHSLPAETHGETSLDVNGVWSSFRGPILNRIATRKGWEAVMASRPSSERNASRRAEEDLRRRFEEEASVLVARLNKTYTESLRVPLAERGIFPRDLRLSSTSDSLCVTATEAADEQLAAMSPPPTFAGKAPVMMAMHESLVNNSTATALGGREIQSYDMAALLEKILGSMPRGFDNVDGVPWALTLADADPLEIRLADGGLTLTFRCKKITAGPEEFHVPFAVSARYAGSIDGSAIRFERQGDLEFVGPALGAFAKPNERRIDMDELEAKLGERFGMLMREELRFTADQLPFPLPVKDQFVPAELRIADGWLLVGFDTAAAPRSNIQYAGDTN